MPEAARRRAERRAERIGAGTVELEQRLADLVRGGLAAAERAGYGMWEETAARMVDAQAPGLAARVRELGAIPASGPGWPVRLLEECALLHLLDQGWLRREELPEDLAATVRSRVGLPAAADGPPVRDRWLVLAQYDTADAKLTTRRIWLHGTGTGRTALLLSYGAAGRAPEQALPVGLAFEAEVSSYPGAGRLRVALGERFSPPVPSATRPAGLTAAEAATRYGEALCADPWLESWPVTLGRVIPTPDGDSWQLADAEGEFALPSGTVLAVAPRAVAAGRPLRRSTGHGLRRVRPPRLHSPDGVAGGRGRGGAAVLSTGARRAVPATAAGASTCPSHPIGSRAAEARPSPCPGPSPLAPPPSQPALLRGPHAGRAGAPPGRPAVGVRRHPARPAVGVPRRPARRPMPSPGKGRP